MMNWSFLKENVYFHDGSWRDICVQNIQLGDWKNWVEFVNKKYQIEWYNDTTETKEAKIDFEVISQYWDGQHDLCSSAKVFINNIQVNVHFFDDNEIENDLDPTEFRSLEDHNCLMKYLTEVSLLLKRSVIVTPENLPNLTLIKVNGEQIEIPTKSNPPKWP